MRTRSIVTLLAASLGLVAAQDAPTAPAAGLLTPEHEAQIGAGGEKFEYQVSLGRYLGFSELQLTPCRSPVRHVSSACPLRLLTALTTFFPAHA